MTAALSKAALADTAHHGQGRLGGRISRPAKDETPSSEVQFALLEYSFGIIIKARIEELMHHLVRDHLD